MKRPKVRTIKRLLFRVAAMLLLAFWPSSALAAPPVIWSINVTHTAGEGFPSAPIYAQDSRDLGTVTTAFFASEVDYSRNRSGGFGDIELTLLNNVTTITYDLSHTISAGGFTDVWNRIKSSVSLTIWAPIGDTLRVTVDESLVLGGISSWRGDPARSPIVDIVSVGTASGSPFYSTIFYDGVEYGQLFDVWNNGYTTFGTDHLWNYFGPTPSDSASFRGVIKVTAENLSVPDCCTPGRIITDVNLPEVRFKLLKVKNALLEMVFPSINLDFTIYQPVGGELCRAISELGSLPVRIESPSIPFGRQTFSSTTFATVSLFGGDDPHVQWSSPGFEIRLESPSPLFNPRIFTTPPLSVKVPLSKLGVSVDQCFDDILRTAESYLHTTLSELMFGDLVDWLIIEDPGSTKLLVTDSSGGRVGVNSNGEEISEIPGAIYIPDIPLLALPFPPKDGYVVSVTADESGDYSIKSGYISIARSVLSEESKSFLPTGASDYHHIRLSLGGLSLLKAQQSPSSSGHPRLSYTADSGTFMMSWGGDAQGYALEYSEDLLNWNVIKQISGSGFYQYLIKEKGFFRLRAQPD